jgi:hypothetical protein
MVMAFLLPRQAEGVWRRMWFERRREGLSEAFLGSMESLLGSGNGTTDDLCDLRRTELLPRR